MTVLLRQSTTWVWKAGPFLSDSNGTTSQTNLSMTASSVMLSKAGAAFAAMTNTGTWSHDSDGYYSVTFGTTDTNTLGSLRAKISLSGSLPVWEPMMVVTPEFYDYICSTGMMSVKLGNTSHGGNATTITGTFAGTVTGVVNGVSLQASQHVIVDSGTITTFSGTVAGVTNPVTLTSAYDPAKTAAQAATALSNATWTTTMATYLDAAISTRSTFSGGTISGVTNPVTLTSAYDAAKTAAPASTALSNATWTDAKAAFLNTTLSTLSTYSGGTISGVTNPVTLTSAYDAAKTAAQASTALSNATWTTTLASYLDAAISSRSTLSTTDVNTEVADVIRTDVIAELSSVPAANPSLHTMMAFIYQKMRNQEVITSTQSTLSKDAGTVFATATISDTASTLTKGKYS